MLFISLREKHPDPGENKCNADTNAFEEGACNKTPDERNFLINVSFCLTCAKSYFKVAYDKTQDWR